MPLHTYIDRGFKGVDTYSPPSALPYGVLTRADNFTIDGPNGDLVTRPGVRGVLTTAHGAPVYGLFERVLSDGTKELLYSSGGKMYRLPVGSATASEILLGTSHFALNSPGVVLARTGAYVYGVDGQGPLFKVDGSTGTALTGLSAVTAGVKAALSSTTIDAFNSVSGWSTDAYESGAYGTDGKILNKLPGNGQFTADDSPVSGSASWTSYRTDGPGTGAFEFFPADSSNPSERYIRMDDPPSAFKSTAPILNAQVYETIDGTPTATGRYATQFDFSCRYNAQYPNDGGIFTVEVYSDTGGATLLARDSQTFTQAGISAVLSWAYTFDFSAVDTPIRSYRLFVQAGLKNTPGTNGPYFGHLFLAPADFGIKFIASGGQVGIGAKEANNVASLGGARLIKDLTVGASPSRVSVDFSQYSHIAIGLTQIATFTNLNGVLGFRKTTMAGGTTVYSNPWTLSDDGKYIFVDISTLDPSDLTDIRYLEILFTSDLDVTATASVLFALGPFTSAGNLSVGYADYQYYYTEVYDEAGDSDTTFGNLIETSPSPLSNAITPTDEQATAILTLPAPVNTSAHFFRIYRGGGVVGYVNGQGDGLYRLLGTWKRGTDGASLDNPNRIATYYHTATADYPNGYVTDDVFDEDLLDETTVAEFGRDPLPSGAQALAVFQGRLAAGVGSDFYWSWLVDDTFPYFNSFLDPNDPQAAEKGGLYPVGGADNDPITRFDPFASQLIIEKARSVWVGVGSDALDMRVQQYLSSDGVGCVGLRGGAKLKNHVWMRGPDSLYIFNADLVTDVGTAIEKTLINYAPGATPADSLLVHNRFLHLFTRGDDGSGTSDPGTPRTAWVQDSRTNYWTRWTGTPFTGGVSLSAGSSQDAAYFGGYDGQIYQLTGVSDSNGPGTADKSFHWTVTSRAFGAETGREVVGARVLCHVVTSEATTLTLTVAEDGGAGRSDSLTYGISGAGEYRLRLPLTPGKARGRALTVTVAGTCLHPVRVQALGVEVTTGSMETN